MHFLLHYDIRRNNHINGVLRFYPIHDSADIHFTITNIIHQHPNNSSLIYNGQVIDQRADGYVNATQMAKANGVEIRRFNESEYSKNYLKALSNPQSRESGLTAKKPVIVESIGFPGELPTVNQRLHSGFINYADLHR